MAYWTSNTTTAVTTSAATSGTGYYISEYDYERQRMVHRKVSPQDVHKSPTKEKDSVFRFPMPVPFRTLSGRSVLEQLQADFDRWAGDVMPSKL